MIIAIKFNLISFLEIDFIDFNHLNYFTNFIQQLLQLNPLFDFHLNSNLVNHFYHLEVSKKFN